MPDTDRTAAIADIRAFNRFYTQVIGVLEEGLLASEYSLTEVRVMYELAHRDEVTAADLARDLTLDPGYVSRLLARFARRRLIARAASPHDGRSRLIRLSKPGRAVYEQLDRRSSAKIGELIAALDGAGLARLTRAMQTIRATLAPEQRPCDYSLRGHRPGDMGWIAHRHGVIYSQEYGWDERFEALVAHIAADFVDNFKPHRERCWIAERDGEFLGCVFLVEKDASTAQLRLLLVEPHARGLGLGKRLVDECVQFARVCGYRSIMLWTNSALHAARHIYECAGFVLDREEKHHSYGAELTGQYWAMTL